MEIKQYTKERLQDVLQFERDLRAEEDFWGWEIDEKYIADVTASFENPTFSDSLSLLAYLDGKQRKGKVRDYERVRRAIGPEQADRILEAAYQQEQAEKERKRDARQKARLGAR